MGMTRSIYSLNDKLWLLTTRSTRTQRSPTVEQNSICHIVRVIGKGKPEKARSPAGERPKADGRWHRKSG